MNYFLAKYRVTFPLDLDVNMKAVLLGTSLLIVNKLFKRR